ASRSMLNLSRVMVLSGLFLLLLCTPLLAADAPTSAAFSGAAVGAGIGAGVTIVGAGLGFGKIGAAALESMARQPEVAGRVQTAMLIIAAMFEGATLFSVIVCLILSLKS